MSDDHSNLDKNLSKFPKKRGGGVGGGGGPPNDYKQPKRNHNKDYQVLYESKGYDKPPRDQQGPNKGNYSPAYDDYGSKPSRNDNYPPYKSKTHNTRQRVPNVWRKKTNKISRDNILETFSRVESHKDIEKWLKDYKELFVKERQPPVNDEVFQLDPNDGLMAKTSRAPPAGGVTHKENDSVVNTNVSTTGTNPNKGLEMFDFAQERHDPIQALRERLKGNDKGESKEKKRDEEHYELLEDEEAIKALKGNQYLGDFEGEELGGRGDDEELEKRDKELGLEDEEEKYSDIDAMFEKKLKNNEIQETFDDAFDDLIQQDGKKQQLAQMEDDERPVWEDIDTNKVIEDIKKEDFLSTLPQDKGAIFGKEYQEKSFQEPKKQIFGGFGQDDDKGFGNNFEIDFSKVSFDFDLKPSNEAFVIKNEDLFPSFIPGASKQTGFGVNEGNSMNYANAQGFGGPMMQQQGNMSKGPQQNTNLNNMNPMYQFQQMPNMMPMQQRSQHMQQTGQLNPIEALIKMHQQPKYPPQGNQPFMQNQPQMKPEGRQSFTKIINPTYPSFIFKYFVSNYDEKVWYYIDLQKRVQGPFSGKIMDEWYINGHLPLSLHVTIGNSNGYKTLKELADLIVNKSIGADEHMYQQPAETKVFEATPNPQLIAGFFDLLKSRPDLAYGTNTQIPAMGKAKKLDEVEKVGGHHGPNYQDDYRGANQNYYQKGGPNGPMHGGNYEGQQYQNQKNVQKKGDYDIQQATRHKMDQNVDSPNRGIDNQAPMNKQHLPAVQKLKPSSSPGGSNMNTSADSSVKSKTSGQGEGQPKTEQDTAKDNVEKNAVIEDMTNQLKNMLGLGQFGSALGGLGGLVGIGGNPVENLGTTEKVNNSEPVKENKKPEKAPEKQEIQFIPPLEKKEKVTPGFVKFDNINVQENIKKKSTQPQRNGGNKAPKIDTEDFPSLGDAYK